jgi:hypothetical protein
MSRARAKHAMDLHQDADMAMALAEKDFSGVETEHEDYRAVVDRLRRDLDLGMKVLTVDRSYLPGMLFGPNDIFVTVGQDGLVANVAKYAEGRPIVAINPDPTRIDGVLLPFRADQARSAVRNILDRRAIYRDVTLAETLLNDGQKLLAFNDFFVGCRTHVSARYRLETAGQSEAQSSSGVIVSTGAGSTGWLSSIFNMVRGVAGAFAGQASAAPAPVRLPWEDRRLVYIVREPFVSKTSRASLVAGVIASGQELLVESMMPKDGVIFSDGVEEDFLTFASGTVARIRAADQRARLVVPTVKR